MTEKYPFAMRYFHDWIDAYKKRNKWKSLFNASSKHKAPKFHELPLAMQLGICQGYFFKHLTDVEIFEICKAEIEKGFKETQEGLERIINKSDKKK